MEKIDVSKFQNRDYQKAIEELLRKILSDRKVWTALQGVGVDEAIARANLGTILEFYDNFYACEKYNSDPGDDDKRGPLQLNLRLEDGVLMREYAHCQADNAKIKRSRNVIYSDLPSEWSKYRLNGDYTADITTKRGPLILEFLSNLKDPKHWIFISGDHNKGKSFLASIYFNEVISRNLGTAAFVDTPQAIKEVNDVYFNNRDEADKMLQKMADVDYLFLDGFGNEYISDFTRDNFILPLISERSKEKKITVFISNYHLDDIDVVYGLRSKAGQLKARQIKSIIKANITQEYYLDGIETY
ncbi:MAG: hypothetical protein LKE36_01010 [Bacilli bacterium]|jgi:DNA replication protein DnaC|nr:hypothetical protein [Bacilli bacterium]